MWNDRYSAASLSLPGRANFDPATMKMAGSIGATAIGTAVSAGAPEVGSLWGAPEELIIKAIDRTRVWDHPISKERVVAAVRLGPIPK
jgi:hypothetical protein